MEKHWNENRRMRLRQFAAFRGDVVKGPPEEETQLQEDVEAALDYIERLESC